MPEKKKPVKPSKNHSCGAAPECGPFCPAWNPRATIIKSIDHAIARLQKQRAAVAELTDEQVKDLSMAGYFK